MEERSNGSWTPSPGSIYPTLQSLEDQGLLAIDAVDGRRTATLTDDGRAWVDAHADENSSLFDTDDGEEAAGAIRAEMAALRDAAIHVARHRDNRDVTSKATAILANARRELYRLLADDEA